MFSIEVLAYASAKQEILLECKLGLCVTSTYDGDANIGEHFGSIVEVSVSATPMYGHIMPVLSGDLHPCLRHLEMVPNEWRKVIVAKRLPLSTENKMSEEALCRNELKLSYGPNLWDP